MHLSEVFFEVFIFLSHVFCKLHGNKTYRYIFLQVLQLYQISQLNHGLMMVGPSGSGKSTAWKVLLKALERLEGVEGVSHVIDPKVGLVKG